MCFRYISPEGSAIYGNVCGNNGTDLLEDCFLDAVTKYPNAHLLVAGDMNARYVLLQDTTVSDDIEFIFYDDSFYENDDFDIRRNSKHEVQNNFGVSLIDLCKSF